MSKYRKIFVLMIVLLSVLGVSAQNIEGRVIDIKTKEALIGATLMIEDTQVGGATDFDGNFVIHTSTKAGNLKVSYMGYASKVVPYKTGELLIIEMGEESQLLDELVVIGFGVQKKSDLTGAVSSVKASDINTLAATNAVSALQGKASGVEIVQNSGAPGSSTSIRIRGMGTVNNSDPLYVVDGIPMDDINYLSNDEIKSIEILKDAASAAIYGSRAANGVVLVTTKSGKGSDKLFNIDVSGYVGAQMVANAPDIMSKEDYAIYQDYVGNIARNTIVGADGTISINPDYQDKLNSGVNWWDEVSRTGAMYKMNLSIYGGNSNLNYYLSGNILGTEGTIDLSDYVRKSFNAKINTKLLDNLSLGTNITYSREDRTIVTEGQWGVTKMAMNYSPLTPIYDSQGNYNYSTPVENLRRATYDWHRNSLVGQVNANWDITEGLKFTSRASLSLYLSDQDEFNRSNKNPNEVGNITYDVKRKPTSQQNISWDNILNYMVDIDKHSINAMVGQTMETSNYSETRVAGTGYGGYDDYYDALNFAGYNQWATGYSTGWASLSFLARVIYDYDDKYLFQANVRADASSRFSKNNRWGYFPSMSLGWKINSEEFMEDVSWISLLKLRAGWGQLGNNRIGNYQYANLVVDSNEQYIYGVGMPAIKPGLSVTQYGNPDILWERTESYSLGLDFNVLSNKLTSSVDFFLKDTKDMLLSVPIVYSAGWNNNPMQNAGSVRNVGAEVQLSYKGDVGDFRYEVSGNLTYIENEVTSLGKYGEPIQGGNLTAPNNLGYVNKTVVGAPIACFYGWKTDGLMQPSDFDENGNAIVPTFASTTPYNPGDMKFVDINGDNVIDDNDRTFIGSPHPDLYYGLTVNLGYKGFDLSMFMQGVSGNSIYNVSKLFQYSPVSSQGVWLASGNNGYSNAANDYFDLVYRPELAEGATPTYQDNWGANTDGVIPTPSTDSSRNEMNFRNSDFFVEDGSYFRMKNVQLSYTFSKDFCKKAKINSLKAYVSATNLFTLTNYTGLDPEVGKRVGEEGNNLFIGIDEGTYPQSQNFMFGFMFGF